MLPATGPREELGFSDEFLVCGAKPTSLEVQKEVSKARAASQSWLLKGTLCPELSQKPDLARPQDLGPAVCVSKLPVLTFLSSGRRCFQGPGPVFPEGCRPLQKGCLGAGEPLLPIESRESRPGQASRPAGQAEVSLCLEHR